MASASGVADDGLVPGEFNDRVDGVRYRVYEQTGKVWMSFEREGKNGTRGQRELLYFIGAGKQERSYLFEDDGFLFQAPVSWYAQQRRWKAPAAYAQATDIQMNRPATATCLHCHASGVQPPAAGTENKFPQKPFGHGGITCERCHGADVSHADRKGVDGASSHGASSIVNPAHLPAERRDAICMECHFQGSAEVEQPGKHLYDFRPGERLSDYVHSFLLNENQERTPRELSQFEALSRSACRRKSGESMWCASCHDPHVEPTPAEKAAYYRAKCLACHGEDFAGKHHAEKPDCVGCHMPTLPSKGAVHAEATDHRIMQYPSAPPIPQLQVRGKPLRPFPASDEPLATTRDYALAWKSLAERGVDGADQAAEDALRKAVAESPDDAELLAALGFVEQRHFHETAARELYERALKIDPLLTDAAVNLGVLDAHAGDLQRAVRLWQAAFERAPQHSVTGMNLAIAFCAAGQRDVAGKYVQRVLAFNPDYGKAKSLLVHLAAKDGPCRP